MGGLWLLGFWLLLPIGFLCEVSGSPGEGRSVWGGSYSLYPTNQSQLFTYGTFPSDFMWGVGSSSLQMEDDHSNRGASIWDTLLRGPQLNWQAGNSTQEQPSKSPPALAHAILPALQFLGVNFYHFSLSWPRLFPEGSGAPSENGVQYYNNVIDSLISNKLVPVITLYHWDLPVAIQERYGGWPNHTVTQLFHDYAKFCFHKFGDRVKYWITMHNPYLIAWHGYGTGLHAPWQKWDMQKISLVAHNLIKAHAMVWHTYNTHFRPLQKGYLSVTLGSHWVKPANTSRGTIEQSQESIEAVLGWFAKPIHYDGDYPESLKTKYHFILPNFTEAEKAFIKGTADFFALSFGSNDFSVSNNDHSLNLRAILNWIKMEYDNPRILIMENGWFSDSPVRTEDTVIVYMMKKFINDVLQAIKHDAVNVFGYTAWSLADTFEWHNGFKLRRGLFYVDFHNKDKPMTPKSSAFYYKQVVQQNGFPQGDSASEVFGQFPCDFNWGVTESVLKAESNPSSPQFIDRQLYVWNITGDGILHAVQGVKLKTRPAQCTDFTSIRKHIEMLTRMKVTHYKFALNWSLILPKGDLSLINREVLRYYRCMVDEAYLQGIKTMIMLYYPTNSLNLPGPLLQNGGWLNKTITQAFADYADLCFREMGDLVKQWITVNEPSKLGQLYRRSTYQAVHNVLIAHAMAWHTYDKKYRSIQHGYVSTALHADWAEPANPFIKSHTEAAERFLEFNIAWLAEPIFGSGDYPIHMRQYINAKRQRGLSNSSLPYFTQEEKLLVKGSADFFAINHFTTWLVRHQPLNDFDQDINPFTDVTCLHSPGKMAVVPSGMTKLLKWIKRNYGDTSIYITANGIDDHSSKNDEIRIYYLQQYSRHLLQAYREDNINLKGYYAFKLTDSAVPRYGFYSSTMKAKPSVDAYSAIISRNGFLLDPSANTCGTKSNRAECSFCVFLEQRKALIFFSCCLISTSVLLLTVTLIRKYKKRRRKLHAEKRKTLVCVLPRKKDSFRRC
ncbi:beta-klotho [Xenopus laevis]|uniref:Klotho beta n=2 Tax=Xenopus laevis TaxID=8355 RepID=A0A974DRI2_XENLA|nr:beta-klotho [Xenopus laevis]OCT96779.1 hypothetical protein XELAEV_18008994mg [Xenopus laevis]